MQSSPNTSHACTQHVYIADVVILVKSITRSQTLGAVVEHDGCHPGSATQNMMMMHDDEMSGALNNLFVTELHLQLH